MISQVEIESLGFELLQDNGSFVEYVFYKDEFSSYVLSFGTAVRSSKLYKSMFNLKEVVSMDKEAMEIMINKTEEDLHRSLYYSMCLLGIGLVEKVGFAKPSSIEDHAGPYRNKNSGPGQ